MPEYLGNMWFWFAVVVVALATNFVYNWITKRGKLI
jgi:hypothetical protein